MFALIALLISTYDVSFFAAFISLELVSHGLEPRHVGFVLGAHSFVYLFCCLVYPYCCERTPRKIQFIVSFLWFGVTFVLMGPSLIFELPDGLWVMASSMIFLGAAMPFIFIPCIPEMMERLRAAYEIKEGEDSLNDDLLNDKVNDSFGTVWAIGTFISPLLGGRLYTSLGMRTTCDLAVAMNVFAIVVFLIFNCGLNVFEENRVFMCKLARYLRCGQNRMATPDQKSVISNVHLGTMARFHPFLENTHRTKEIEHVTIKKAIGAMYFTPQVKKSSKRARTRDLNDGLPSIAEEDGRQDRPRDGRGDPFGEEPYRASSSL